MHIANNLKYVILNYNFDYLNVIYCIVYYYLIIKLKELKGVFMSLAQINSCVKQKKQNFFMRIKRSRLKLIALPIYDFFSLYKPYSKVGGNFCYVIKLRFTQ